MLLRFFVVLQITLFIGFVLLSACSSSKEDFSRPLVPIGNFRLGQVIGQANSEPRKGLLSREASRDEWVSAITLAFNERFERYQGSAYFHLGVTAHAYILAKPGIPILASPKSILIFSVVVVEDSSGKLLTPKPHKMTVVEQINGNSVIGSGYTLSKEEQLNGLAYQAALMTESWLRKQRWFDGPVVSSKPLSGAYN